MIGQKVRIVGLFLSVSIAASLLLSTMVVPAQNTDEYDYYLVEFDGFADQWIKDDVAQLGGEILEYRQDNIYLVRMGTDDALSLDNRPYISTISVLRPEMKMGLEIEGLRETVLRRCELPSS